jgi:type IV pilus assembly protein PilQ
MGSAVAALAVNAVSAAESTPKQNKSKASVNLLAQTSGQQPLVPNPNISIDGIPANNGSGLPPALPRAVAPPVGDISVSNLDASMPQIQLNSSARINMVLKNTPVREVLESLARSANLNLAYSDGGDTKAADGKGGSSDVKITLNLRNEPVQNAFNYVLQMSGLEANRIGNTIFVGTKLPDSIKETIVRTLRLNQVSAAAAANFLSTQGAEAQIASTTVETVSVGKDIATQGDAAGGTSGSALSGVRQTTTPKITTLKAPEGSGNLILKGLSVSTDDRLNTITLVGPTRKVEMATAMLTRLDARRRQVALNVKIVDVNLSNADSISSSLGFKSGDTTFAANAGASVVNFGGAAPPSNAAAGSGIFSTATNPSSAFKLLSTIQAQVVSGNAKILTDPTLVVQEGQRSTVNLTQEVFAGFKITTSNTTPPIITREVLTKNAGLILDVLVNRIDDNGFVSVAVSPTVSSVGSTLTTPDGDVSFLQSRTMNSGDIRLRDGQTLILSGIIQESDRASVTKVPILGDIPLLGALFRSTSKQNQRQEVVVLLTPQIMDDQKAQVNYKPGVDTRLMLGR